VKIRIGDKRTGVLGTNELYKCWSVIELRVDAFLARRSFGQRRLKNIMKPDVSFLVKMQSSLATSYPTRLLFGMLRQMPCIPYLTVRSP